MLQWLLQVDKNGRQPYLKLFSRLSLGKEFSIFQVHLSIYRVLTIARSYKNHTCFRLPTEPDPEIRG